MDNRQTTDDAMAEDLEEYQTTFYTSPNTSTNSLPPLEKPPQGLIHTHPDMYWTVLDSMKRAVPIDVQASKIGQKKSGLFYIGDTPLQPGEMLFLTNPLSMARSVDDHHAIPLQPGPPRDVDVCDYCFKGIKTFSEDDGIKSQHAAAQRCTGCNLLSFCNKASFPLILLGAVVLVSLVTACHLKAWKNFHKYECQLLKTLKRRDPAFLLYLRVVLMDKAGVVPENIVNVIRNLDNIFGTEDSHMPSFQDIKNCAIQSLHLLSLENRDYAFVRDLLCRILGNQVVAACADETVLVHCTDVALALLNHCCDANAFVFVEGHQARVRSIKTIQPGDEITISLVDPRLDAYSRQCILKFLTWKSSFDCRCSMCRDELEQIIAGNTDGNQIKKLHQHLAETISKAKELIPQIKTAVWADKKTSLVELFVRLADELVAKIGKDMLSGPYSFKPIPWLRMAGASMFLDVGDLENALYNATLSVMLCKRRFGPHSVADLRVFVNTLKAICELPQTDKLYRSFFKNKNSSPASPFPTQQELSAFTVCCLIDYELLAVKVYGPKLGFVRAVLHWGQEVERLCEPLQPCTVEFDEAAQTAQGKLMAWCLGDRVPTFYPITLPTEALRLKLKTAVASLENTSVSTSEQKHPVKSGQDEAQPSHELEPKGYATGEESKQDYDDMEWERREEEQSRTADKTKHTQNLTEQNLDTRPSRRPGTSLEMNVDDLEQTSNMTDASLGGEYVPTETCSV